MEMLEIGRFIPEGDDCLEGCWSNHYWCDDCQVGWIDVWFCVDDDLCPQCNIELGPWLSYDHSKKYERCGP